MPPTNRPSGSTLESPAVWCCDAAMAAGDLLLQTLQSASKPAVHKKTKQVSEMQWKQYTGHGRYKCQPDMLQMNALLIGWKTLKRDTVSVHSQLFVV